MQRIAIFLFGLIAHAMFLAVFAYMAAFVGNFVVPRTIDAPATTTPLAVALVINLLLLGAFGVQHSVMARPGFKRWWTQFVPAPVERSVYVMISNLLVIAMFALWQPIDTIVWNITNPIARGATWGLFAAGWLLIPGASFLINHFDLFGTRQVWLHLKQRPYTNLPFRTPVLYRFVRHPLYVGWMLAFWVTPTMTVGHLLFASVLSAYMLIAIQFEERDLVAHFGELYENYRRRVPMLVPLRRQPARDAGELVPTMGTESMN